MEVDFAFLSDVAHVADNKLYVLGGAFDTIWARTAPAVHSRLAFVMRLLLSPAELDRKHALEISVVDADGKAVGGRFKGEINVQRNSRIPSGLRQGILVTLDFQNLKFEKFGEYTFDVLVNNSSVKTVDLRVVQLSDAKP